MAAGLASPRVVLVAFVAPLAAGLRPARRFHGWFLPRLPDEVRRPWPLGRPAASSRWNCGMI